MSFLHTILMGTIAGLVPAILVDIGSYKNAVEKDATEKFNWKLAAIRWLYGAASGAAAAAGYKGVVQP
jgi:hypothetical protein